MARISSKRTARASRDADGRVPVLLALGGNQWHGRHGPPRAVLRAAVAALRDGGLQVLRVSAIIDTAPMGPSRRRYANAVVLGTWAGEAAALHRLTRGIELGFGRRGGRRWGARVLDIDVLDFGGAIRPGPALRLPHPGIAARGFVLQPLVEVAPDWVHPERRLSARQLLHRLGRARPLA